MVLAEFHAASRACILVSSVYHTYSFFLDDLSGCENLLLNYFSLEGNSKSHRFSRMLSESVNLPSTVLLCVFWIKVCMIRPSVCCSKPQWAASLVKTFQNWRSVSLGCCLREKQLKRSNVLFQCFLNVFLQLILISFSDAVATVM